MSDPSTDPSKEQEMACRELVRVISAYLDGSLPAEDRRRFEAHLEECSYCVNYLDQMRETIAALGYLSADSIAPETRREIVVAFGEWRGRG
jgi:anti-sigma factor (TIGR02949 family)